MATEVIRSIRASGGDYSTLAGWIAGEARNLVSADEICIGELYHDWPAGFNGNLSITSAGGWTVSAGNFVVLRANPGHKHTGQPYASGSSGDLSGAGISNQGSGPAILVSAMQHFQVRDLICIATAANQQAIFFGSSNCIAVNCFVRANETFGVQGALRMQGNASSAINCVAWDSRTGIYCNNAGADGFALNCTAWGTTQYGFVVQGGSSHAVNCLAVPAAGDGFVTAPGGTTDYCATTDSSLVAGTGNRNSQTFSFESTGDRNFRLTALDTGAKGHGQDLSAHPTFPFSTDIVGAARGSTWDIGAFQYQDEGGDPEPVLITSSDVISCAALSAASVGGHAYRSDLARLRSIAASSAAAQVDGIDTASVGGLDSLRSMSAAVSGSETLAVRVVESLPMVAVMIARGDEIGAAAAEDAGVVLVRVDRTDAIALSAPTVAQVMARLDATDDLSLSLAEASRLIGELVQISSSDALGVGASEDADTSIHAHAEDWLRPALVDLLGDVFAALSAGDQTALGVVDAADIAAALRSGDTLSVMVDESEPVVTVIIEVSDSIALRVSASGVVDVITSATGRLLGVVRVVEALGGDAQVGPALGGSARLNPEAD